MSTPWWRQAAVYQIYPRSFMDASGDGSGDLAGVTQRLPYLASLGVDAIWLSPFYPSPQLDGGYDVVDPRGVDPLFGTSDDARELIEQAHANGLRVIVDVVPNHFSTAHPWFQAALAAGPGSPERDRFHFRAGHGPDGDEPPNNWTSIFGGPAWTRVTEPDGSAGQWFLNLFDSSQADLNWTHPDVAEDFLATLRFWLDLGVDGFRVDVAFGLAKDMSYADAVDPAALETERVRLDSTEPGEQEATHEQVFHSPYLDRDETLEYYTAWRRIIDDYPGDRMAIGEAWLTPERARRYVAGNGLHQI
ncbi:MAG: alpha-amylase family glycosyl hydrolase, partial [Actinomycetota bacterium]